MGEPQVPHQSPPILLKGWHLGVDEAECVDDHLALDRLDGVDDNGNRTLVQGFKALRGTAVEL